MTRLFHFSDTHLGHQQYPRTSPQGLNQREVDHYAAFNAVIDQAVEARPDLVIHAGDLFDGVRPSNRALAVALEGFLKLSQAGIPAVVIAGNHEHPKMRETGSPFRLLEHLPGIHPVYKGHRESIDVAGIAVHAVPQCADNAALRGQVEAAQPEAGDVLVLHGAVQDLPAFRHAEFNELMLDPHWFEPYAYVALGHYHARTEVAPNAWYCGAPDRVSMAESGQEKGFLEVRTGPGAPDVSFHALAGRMYADLPPIDAGGMDASAVASACLDAVARVPEGAVARLTVADLAPELRGLLDVKAIHAAARHALHLELRLQWRGDDQRVQGSAEIRGLSEEFESFAAHHPIEDLDRDRLLAMAREVLSSA